MKTVLLICLSVACYLHILRDICQIKYGYNHWFTKWLHFWHKPQYEIHGIIVLLIIGTTALLLAIA